MAAATEEASVLREQLEEARGDARTDPLTELPNRRAFVESFGERAAAGASLCLAVCDIDHFKDVNDRFGHAVGDRVLKALGQSAAALRRPARLALRRRGIRDPVRRRARRTGRGDAGGCARAGRGQKVSAAREASPLGSVTFSAGLVAVAPGEGVAEAFARADGLLYAAKTGGRNRIVARPSVR